VVLGELASCGTRIQYRAVNSCLRFLPTIDGCELLTVESLQDATGRLHPVQQAMVDWHASQCGFCTPGFVMSLLALYLQQGAGLPEALSREQVVTALSGNLCRCTGYRPIIEAGCHVHEYPLPVRWNCADAQSASRIERLRSLRSGSLQLPGFLAPTTLAELAEALQAQPDAQVLAGGTDVGLLVTKELRELPSIVYLGRVEELRQVRSTADTLEIGAAVCLSDAWAAIVASYPQLAELAARFASPPVCNSGTLCGNLANGSPIGDSMPILIALGAQLALRCGSQTRCLPLEQFYLGYRRTVLRPGEFITTVSVPQPRPQLRCASYKIAKRFDQDISAVCAGIAVTLDEQTISGARLAFGGMAATPARAAAAEAALLGQRWSEVSWNAAAAALQGDFQPLSDQRASSEYRLQVAGNLLRRFYLEYEPGSACSRLDAVLHQP
jgi:xanthine dehydrogenase small subunit